MPLGQLTHNDEFCTNVPAEQSPHSLRLSKLVVPARVGEENERPLIMVVVLTVVLTVVKVVSPELSVRARIALGLPCVRVEGPAWASSANKRRVACVLVCARRACLASIVIV